MPWAAAAAVAGAVISSEAAGDASQQQAESTAQGLAEQRRQYDIQRSDLAPYREAGGRALSLLEGGISTPVTAEEAMSDPGYQFGLSQGQQALDRKTAAAGGRVSGAALKSAAEYATNYATTGYNAAYQRRQDRLNRLAALAGIGQTATGSSAAAGARSADAITGLITGQGDASAAGRLYQGNIWGNTANQLGAIGKKWADTPTATAPSTTGTGGYTYDGVAYNNPSAYVGGAI